LLHDETQVTKIEDELCKAVLKLGNPMSSMTFIDRIKATSHILV